MNRFLTLVAASALVMSSLAPTMSMAGTVGDADTDDDEVVPVILPDGSTANLGGGFLASLAASLGLSVGATTALIGAAGIAAVAAVAAAGDDADEPTTPRNTQ
jgi:hypothetical protein